jgi:hypothetical protein
MELFHTLRHVDASILFEVLLHQDNYVEVIRQVCSSTRKYICVAQPCLRETFSTLPASSVLLQFYDEELKNLLREDSFWPKEPKSKTFRTDRWMWGQTTSHLVDVFKGYGWRLKNGKNVTNACGHHWDYPLMVFSRL